MLSLARMNLSFQKHDVSHNLVALELDFVWQIYKSQAGGVWQLRLFVGKDVISHEDDQPVEGVEDRCRV
jgi:hypothetical protein